MRPSPVLLFKSIPGGNSSIMTVLLTLLLLLVKIGRVDDGPANALTYRFVFERKVVIVVTGQERMFGLNGVENDGFIALQFAQQIVEDAIQKRK